MATTTTTVLAINGEGGADPELAALIRALYDLPQSGVTWRRHRRSSTDSLRPPPRLTPQSAAASVGAVGDAGRVAVVTAGDDITLAVADPNMADRRWLVALPPTGADPR